MRTAQRLLTSSGAWGDYADGERPLKEAIKRLLER
jgi:hypothetical protein